MSHSKDVTPLLSGHSLPPPLLPLLLLCHSSSQKTLSSSPLRSSPLPWHGSIVYAHITFAARHPSPRVPERPGFFIHSHYLHKQSPSPFRGQSRLNLCGSFMYCLLTVPLCPPAIGPGSGYNVPGVIEAD